MYIIRSIILLLIITVLASLIDTHSAEVDCKIHAVYCQITRNHPTLNKNYAMRLSNEIFKVTRKYDIPANIFTAMLMQESRYRLSARGCHSGIPRDSVIGEVVTICSDFGITMINYKTAREYKFDIHRLTTDLSYSVESGAIVLSWFKDTYAHKEIDWWVRYNCGVKKSTKRDTCVIYRTFVERFL